MAQNQNVEIKATIKVDSTDAQKEVGKVTTGLETVNETTKKAEKNAKAAGGAFSSIGNSLKSLGIIAVINKGLQFFQQVLGQNQKVADLFSTSLNFLTGVFSDLVIFIVDNAGAVVDFFKDIFENPVENIKAFGKAIVDNIIERVKSLFEAFGLLSETIKNIFTGEFDAAIASAKKFGKEVVDVVTGVDDAFDKSAKLINETADAAGKYFNSKLEQAKALTKATNDAVIAEAKLLQTIKQTEIAAEQLRQQRDDENKSLADRLAANEKLGETLRKGQQQELALLDIKAAKIQNEIKLNGITVEKQAELIQLQGERADIEEKYTAFASEQLINRIALQKEQAQIERSLAENQNKLLLDTQKANAELIKDDVARLEAKKQILEEESQLELARLQANIDNTTAGTTARVEAEIEFATKKNEIANQLAATDNQLQTARLNKELETIAAIREAEGVAFAERVASLDLEQQALDEALANKLISEKEYNEKVKVLTDQRISYQEAEKQAKLDFALAVGNIFGQLSGLFEQGTAAAKVSALAEIAIGTGVGFVQGLNLAQKAAAQSTPFAFPIFYATQIAAVLGAAARAKQVLSAVRGGASGTGGTASAPSVGGAAPIAPAALQPIQTTLDQGSINQIGNVTSRAYVVESDVSDSQERIRRINRAARFG